MANPQLENGFVKIATEIFEAMIKIRIPGEARQVLDFIIRKTYGFNKKEDAIALTQFVIWTGLKKPTVCKAIKKLLDMKIITQKDNDVAKKYSLQKNFDEWKPLPKKATVITQKGNSLSGDCDKTIIDLGSDSLPKKVTDDEPLPKKVTVITQKGNNHYPKRIPQKTITKDNVTKDNSKIPEDLNTEEFNEIWDMWICHRTEKKKPLTATSTAMQLKKLQKMGQKRAIRAIEHSIANGWTGIFEPRMTPEEQYRIDNGILTPEEQEEYTKKLLEKEAAERKARQEADPELTQAERSEKMREILNRMEANAPS